jgi:hypothetical protein
VLACPNLEFSISNRSQLTYVFNGVEESTALEVAAALNLIGTKSPDCRGIITLDSLTSLLFCPPPSGQGHHVALRPAVGRFAISQVSKDLGLSEVSAKGAIVVSNETICRVRALNSVIAFDSEMVDSLSDLWNSMDAGVAANISLGQQNLVDFVKKFKEGTAPPPPKRPKISPGDDVRVASVAYSGQALAHPNLGTLMKSFMDGDITVFETETDIFWGVVKKNS